MDVVGRKRLYYSVLSLRMIAMRNHDLLAWLKSETQQDLLEFELLN